MLFISDFTWSVSVNAFLGVSVIILISVVIKICRKKRTTPPSSPDSTITSFLPLTPSPSRPSSSLSSLRPTASSPDIALPSLSTPRMGVRALQATSSPRMGARCVRVLDLRSSPVVTRSKNVKTSKL